MSDGETDEIVRHVIDIIAARLQILSSSISDESQIMSELGADSLDVLFIVGAIENHFDLDIPEGAVAGARTPRDIAERISSHLKGPSE